jgi:hypothetical protein
VAGNDRRPPEILCGTISALRDSTSTLLIHCRPSVKKAALKSDARREATAQGERSVMVDDNVCMFPQAIGPLLIEYYAWLMKEPLPQQLKDQLAMLAEATGSVDFKLSADAEALAAAVPQASLPDKHE